MNNLTKNRYTELLELLEIPQLMDTTVRNGYYDEALELIEFVRKLEKVKNHYLANIMQVFLEIQLNTSNFGHSSCCETILPSPFEPPFGSVKNKHSITGLSQNNRLSATNELLLRSRTKDQIFTS